MSPSRAFSLLVPPLAALLLPAAALAEERPAAQLFPQAMEVEHQLVEREADGTVFYGEPVRDTYGGSWIVSERSDGSRLVIDLARREMTEVRPAEGLYWTIGFARFGELRARAALLDGGRTQRVAAKSGTAGGPAELELVELGAAAAKSLAGREAPPAALAAPGIRRFEVREKGSARPGAEVWVDPRLRLGEGAGAALEAFEKDALGADGAGEGEALAPARVLAAVRRATAGALPVLTVLPVLRPSGEAVGQSEDRVILARRIEAFPAELARVPAGLRRASHPLESIVLALEEQARVEAALAGRDLP